MSLHPPHVHSLWPKDATECCAPEAVADRFRVQRQSGVHRGRLHSKRDHFGGDCTYLPEPAYMERDYGIISRLESMRRLLTFILQVHMARESGATRVLFVSCSPEVIHPHVVSVDYHPRSRPSVALSRPCVWSTVANCFSPSVRHRSRRPRPYG